VKAFQRRVYPADALGQSRLPGINGTYDRVTCNRKMEKEIEEAVTLFAAGEAEHQGVLLEIGEFEEDSLLTRRGLNGTDFRVKYCRRCELSCPVGR
jgi:epoxyqueuosine reductase